MIQQFAYYISGEPHRKKPEYRLSREEIDQILHQVGGRKSNYGLRLMSSLTTKLVP